MAQDAPQDSAGPSSPPPQLPDGWLAQWEGVSRKWYFVQRATGKSQWEIPTEPVILTPSTTPGSIGAGPTQAPRMISPAVSPIEGMNMNYGADRGIFTHSTERAGLSGLLGSHGGGSGLTQLADRMLNKLSKEFMPGKTGANAYQQFPPGHPNHPASQHPYGQAGRPTQYQSAANPYGYASIGQTGSYTGDVPQYHPQGQGQGQPMSPGGFHQHPGIHPAYSHQQYPNPNQPAMTPQFSPVSPASQHSWQGHQQPPPGYQPAYQVPEMQGSMDGSHAPVSPVAQPQWQLGPQPTIPHATKPTVNHLQQDPNHPAPTASQPQFHNPPIQQPPQQPNQFTGNPYQQGHPIYEAPGDIQMARPTSQNRPDPTQQQMASMHHQHGSQHGTPFTPGSGGIPAPPAVASNYANNSSMTSLSGPNANPQQSNLSHHPSLTSLSSNQPPTNRPSNSFIAELPDNQVTSHAPNHPASQPNNPPQNQPPPPNGMVAEMPGSEPPIRHTPTDPQFVSGPWTLPPPPPQNRYNNSGGFSQ